MNAYRVHQSPCLAHGFGGGPTSDLAGENAAVTERVEARARFFPPKDFRVFIITPSGSSQELWRAAVHEAGHAVAAAEAGVSINELTLDPWRLRPDQWGYIHFGGHSTPTVLMGGMAAEIAVFGSAGHQGISGDRDQLARVGFPAEVLRSGWLATFRTIRRRRPAVLAIAQALMKEGTLLPVELYEDIIPPFFPEVGHPGMVRFEPSFTRLAAAWDRRGLGWEE